MTPAFRPVAQLGDTGTGLAPGGGAFTHAARTLPRVDVAGVTEADFRCGPLRGDSLAFHGVLHGRRTRLRRFFSLTEAGAAAVIAERLGTGPTRAPGAPARVTRRMRLVAGPLGTGRRPDRGKRFRLPVRKAYRSLFSPGSAACGPPFLRSSLRDRRDPGGAPAAPCRGDRAAGAGGRPARGARRGRRGDRSADAGTATSGPARCR